MYIETSAFFRVLISGESKKKIATIVRYGNVEKDARIRKEREEMGLRSIRYTHYPAIKLLSAKN